MHAVLTDFCLVPGPLAACCVGRWLVQWCKPPAAAPLTELGRQSAAVCFALGVRTCALLLLLSSVGQCLYQRYILPHAFVSTCELQ